jgi:hypothetical protein
MGIKSDAAAHTKKHHPISVKKSPDSPSDKTIVMWPISFGFSTHHRQSSRMKDVDRGNADWAEFGRVFRVEFLELGQYVLAVGVLAESSDVRAYLL